MSLLRPLAWTFALSKLEALNRAAFSILARYYYYIFFSSSISILLTTWPSNLPFSNLVLYAYYDSGTVTMSGWEKFNKLRFYNSWTVLGGLN